MVEIIPRTAWQDPKFPVTGPALVKSLVKLIPAHYTAAAVVPRDTPPYLRAIQRDYLSRGYSIGYNFAIDQTGQAWECRGFDIKCAANKGRNDETLAFLCLVDGAEPLNAEMVVTFKALGAEAQRRMGHSLTVVGHRDIGATACPGLGIYAQVRAGLPAPADPVVLPPPTTVEGDADMYIADSKSMGSALVRPNFRADGSAGYQMFGFNTAADRAGVAYGVPAKSFTDAEYQTLIAAADPK